MVLLDHGGRDAHELDLRSPPADLSGLIEHCWIEEHRTAPSASDRRVVPDASPHVIAIVTARAQQRAIHVAVVGARSCAADIDVSRRVLTVGVRLHPGALPMLTNASAREFVDRPVPVDDVFGTKMVRDLELGPDAPAAVILHELIRLARRTCGQRTTATMVSAAAGVTTVAELAGRLHTPTRSLRERTYREVGLSPKRMLRVTRLHTALLAARRHHSSWSEIAYAAGYADQAHLSRELRALLGEPPSAWAARGSAVSFKTGSAGLR
jgi:AraC-like DNA-binding protein